MPIVKSAGNNVAWIKVRSGLTWSESTVVTPVTTTTLTTTKSSVKTPNYRSLIRKGDPLPENDFSYTKIAVTPVCMHLTWSDSSHQNRYFYPFQYSFVPSGISSSSEPVASLLAKAKSNCVSNAKGSQWNSALFVAEADKTRDMLLKRILDLVNLAKKLKSGNFDAFINGLRRQFSNNKKRRGKRRFNSRFARDPAGACGSAWLEFSYGWTPFVMDIYDAYNTLHDMIQKPKNQIASATGYARSVTTSSETNRGRRVILALPNETCTEQISYTNRWSAKCTWRFRVKAADLPARLGLVNPLMVAWELVPFSFVVDWVVPVGDYLDQLDLPLRFDSMGGCYGIRRDVVDSFYTILSFDSKDISGSCGGGTGTSVSLQRLKFSGYPLNAFSTLFSAGNIKMSGRRWASAAALLQQQVGRFRR